MPLIYRLTVPVKVRGFNEKLHNKILFLPERVKDFCTDSIT